LTHISKMFGYMVNVYIWSIFNPLTKNRKMHTYMYFLMEMDGVIKGRT